jgi:tight adherence protein B
MLIIYYMIFGTSLFVSLALITNRIIVNRKVIERVNDYTFNRERIEKEIFSKKVKKVNAVSKYVKKQLNDKERFKKYKKENQKVIDASGIKIKVHEYIILRFQFMVILGLITIILAKTWLSGIFLGIAVGAIGYNLPLIFMKVKISLRQKQVNSQLAHIISLLSNSLKAGYGLVQGLENITRETKGPLSEEFEILQREVALGVSVENSLQNISNRLGNDDVDMLITAILIQRQTGGNLSEILDNIAGTINSRIKLAREIKILTAQAKISALMIALVPVVIGLGLNVVNPDQFSVLYTDTLGNIAVGVAVVLELIGAFIISKIIKSIM